MAGRELHELISGYIAVENAVASLYKTFMDIFPDEKPFWQDLYGAGSGLQIDILCQK